MPQSTLAATTALALAAALCTHSASAQAPPAPAVKRTCSVVNPVVTDADRALDRREYPLAETLFRAQLAAANDDESRSEATAGIIRAQLFSGKLKEALAAAKQAVADRPKDAVLQDVLGEVYFRRGEPNEALQAYQTAQSLDLCNPRIHFDLARFDRLAGLYASEQTQLDYAHRLSPQTAAFARAAAPRVQLSAEDRIARMTDRLENGNLSPDERASLQRAIDVARAQSKGSCEITRPVESTKFPLVPIANGPRDMYAAGLDIQLNGKRKRLEIDTGASGLLLSRSAAASAGLITEAETRGGGIGDNGPTKELLAHVDSLRIGELEFHNCLVRVFDKRNVLEVDGLIGADVFSSWVVTLDIPSREVRLSPLPKRPNDTVQTAGLDTAGADQNTQAAPRDRYIAPEMKDWTRVFRYGHNLIFPTFIGKTSSKLFIMDTGAGRTLISPAAAREVTGVSGSDSRIRGISGEVNKVSQTDNIDIDFAHIRSPFRGVTAIDTSNMGRGSGVEISGFIGFDTLRELIISIDYRDNLVHVVYDPKHGFHRQ